MKEENNLESRNQNMFSISEVWFDKTEMENFGILVSWRQKWWGQRLKKKCLKLKHAVSLGEC